MSETNLREISAELESWRRGSGDAPQPDRTLEQPPEVIAQIFKSTLSGIVMLPPFSDNYPWSLGHVCSRWRKILWSVPSFWSDIAIQGLYTIQRGKLDYDESTREALTYIMSNIHIPLSYGYTMTVTPSYSISSSPILEGSST